MFGLIFDMDGVLVNNVVYHLEAWRKLGQEQGRQLTDEAIRATFGQRNQEMLRALLGNQLTESQCRLLADRKEELYRKAIEGHLEAAMVPGLRRFLRESRNLETTAAVATSGPMENVSFVIDGLGIRDEFAAFVTSADVRRGKPYPDVFLVAAERLGLPAGRCVVFEDSASGVEAALRAGCLCVAVATTHAKEELLAWSPHVIVADFNELDHALLARKLSE